jgi:pimeloyl-ACP methyl ester carboxylesterase
VSNPERRVPPRSGVLAAQLRPWPTELAGGLVSSTFTSTVLAGNPLGDPAERPLAVYLPPGYDTNPEKRYPSVYVLQGYSGSLGMWSNRTAFRSTYVENIDAMFQRGDAPPCIVVFVDAWTAYGGSQFVDSPGTGRYQTYICDEIVPWVDATYRTISSAAHRGVCGKSSGGFGAMIFAMLRPDLFGALATHAGDTLYEGCYIPEFLRVARALRDRYEGSYEKFWEDFWTRAGTGEAMSRPEDGSLVMVYGCAAAFSAEPDGTVTLPFDMATGRLRDEVWERWLQWDPVRMVAGHAEALRRCRAIWIDAGRSDDWWLDLGAEAFRRELEKIGVGEADGTVHFELFEGTHAAIDYRYPLSLAFLAYRLSP